MSELTVKEASEIAQRFQELSKVFCSNESDEVFLKGHPYEIGQAYSVRTVTQYWTGRLVAVYEQELVLEDAAWSADTGRFSDYFKDGPSECEPVDGLVFIGRGSIVDVEEWRIALPRTQK